MARFVYCRAVVRLGPYETLVDLGRGGMADLHVAQPVGQGDGASLVIVKTLRPPVTDKRIEMFVDEARLGLLFDHPNVVRTLDVGEEEGRHYIALELLDGQPLDQVLHRLHAKRTPDEDTRTILLWLLTEALAGLHHAHELSADGSPLGIVHRDFTPTNVFVTYDGCVKTLDFGIAKSAGRVTRTTTGEVKGKIRYMAAEQALGLRIDRRADIFSAGAILYELLADAPLWDPKVSERDVFDDLAGGAYPTSIPSVSTALNVVLARSLARDASERFKTALEMREALLAEIERRDGGRDGFSERVGALVAELFADRRARTSAMIERVRAARENAPAPPALPVPLRSPPDRASTFRRLLTRFGLSLVLPALLLATPAPARADDASDAEQHFKRGLKLFDEGDFKLALVEFERSYELSPNFRVLYNIGEVQFQLNRYADAYRTLGKYLEVGGDRVLPNRKAEVDRDLESLKIRTAHLRVNVDVAEAEILVDGERIGRAPLAQSELVDAGPHRVAVQKAGFVSATESISLVGGDDKTLTLHLAPIPVAKEEPRPVIVRESSGLGPVWVGWGLTAALAVATVGSVALWQGADGKLEDLKKTQSSSGERASQARTVDTLQTVSLIAGAATLVTAGVSLYLTLRPRGRTTALTIGPGRLDLHATF